MRARRGPSGGSASRGELAGAQGPGRAERDRQKPRLRRSGALPQPTLCDLLWLRESAESGRCLTVVTTVINPFLRCGAFGGFVWGPWFLAGGWGNPWAGACPARDGPGPSTGLRSRDVPPGRRVALVHPAVTKLRVLPARLGAPGALQVPGEALGDQGARLSPPPPPYTETGSEASARPVPVLCLPLPLALGWGQSRGPRHRPQVLLVLPWQVPKRPSRSGGRPPMFWKGRAARRGPWGQGHVPQVSTALQLVQAALGPLAAHCC